MFIHKVLSRTSKKGTKYYTYRLSTSYRKNNKVKQKLLLGLGSNFNIKRSQWPTLCHRIHTLLHGQCEIFNPELPTDLEAEAQRITTLLRAKCNNKKRTRDWQTVDINSLNTIHPRHVGVEHVGLWALKKLGIPALLNECGFSPNVQQTAIGSIIGRLAKPGSERATMKWLRNASGLSEFLQCDYNAMCDMQLYRASDKLYEHRETIESHVFDQAIHLFDQTPTISLYDLTNTFLEGSGDNIDKAKYGRSKERRSDCTLLSLAIVADSSGFVRRSKIFNGNVCEAATLPEMLEALEAPKNARIVMDRGIATEKRVTWLKEHGYRYIVASNEGRKHFDEKRAESIERASGGFIQAYREVAEDEVRLFCQSPAREAKESAKMKQKMERFEAALSALSEGLGRPRTHKRLDLVNQRIGRLKQKYSGVGPHYEITVHPDEDDLRASKITWEVLPQAGTNLTEPGVYCLRSNEMDFTAEQLWRTYVMLTDLESVFRSLKSELGLRPIYHSSGPRAEAHLFITVLAYQLVQVIRLRLREHGERSRWTTLREIFAQQIRATIVMDKPDGRKVYVRKTAQPSVELQSLYEAIGINPVPLSMQKTTV